jgi:hypothetical protein
MRHTQGAGPRADIINTIVDLAEKKGVVNETGAKPEIVSLEINTGKRAKKDNFGAKVKAHQRYYTQDGAMVPGSTTVLGVINKPYLIKWANRLGLEGIDVDKYRDEAADTGNGLHYLLECDVKGVEPDLKDFTPAQVERANLGLAAFRAWRMNEAPDLKPLGIEMRLVSEKYRYGGTLDLYALIKGRYTLVDYKTSASVYLEHKAQATSYARLAQEHGHRLQDVLVLQLPRTEGGTYIPHKLTPAHMSLYWQLFELSLSMYTLQKQIKREGA